MTDTLKSLAEDSAEPEIQSMLREHRQVTHQQGQALEARLKALGEAAGRGGSISTWIDRMWSAIRGSSDAVDRTMYALVKTYSAQHLEIAMYETLRAYAEVIMDRATARLAMKHKQVHRKMADRLQPLLKQFARHAGSVPVEG